MDTFSLLCVRIEGALNLGPKFSVEIVSALDLEAIEKIEKFDAVILGDVDPAVLVQVRSSLRTAPIPVFSTSSELAKHTLSDGLVPDDLGEVLAYARLRNIASASELEISTEAAVLSYLWRLETRCLKPTPDIGSTNIYRYPSLAALGVRDHNRWLVRAERQGLIEPASVVDRTRNCGSCGGAHLNYVDLCPHCNSLDFSQEQAIHCFTCGLVAEQGTFRKGERLVCPKCQTALKHIGTDYDRPIERFRCSDCGERFNDARVKATCLECGTVNAQSALGTNTYRSYRIGPGGESFLRSGGKPTDTVQPFGEAVSHEQFLWTISWLDNLAQMKPESAVVARICVGAYKVASDENIATEKSLRTQIGALLNPVEVLHNYDPQTILILLPSDGEARLDALVTELKALSSAQISDELSLKVEGVRLPLPEIASDARAWLGRFAGRGR